MDNSESKASGFLTSIAVLKELCADRWPTFVAALPADTKALVDRPPLAVAWISQKHIHDLIAAADAAGGKALVREAGRRILLHDLNSIYKMFIRIASPHFIIARAAKVWGTYSRNAGALNVVKTGEGFVELAYTGIPRSSDAYWEWQMGTVRGALEAAGAKGLEVQLTGGGGAGDHAYIRATWK